MLSTKVLKQFSQQLYSMLFLIIAGTELKAAIENAMLPTCQVYLCSVTSEKTKVKLKDISLLNNFLFYDQGVQMFKA